ncbi:hypothetical protein [Amnibacterium sp.]|uniref:DUF6197 family protein n=1 Tax=Amnibacterium sp. TaxID=1872496 RepID=UPI002618B0AE|nr:hypothetical protein [Amnibacterium sp.]MCU1472556.1 hypothetical protein [Amnibacterium sp.]
MSLLDRSRIDLPLARDRRERRRLGGIDRLSAQRALLVRTTDALQVADGVLAGGWLQDRWFAWRDADGRSCVAGSAGAHTVPLDAVTAACLVGALVAGSGGAASPVLRSSVEATWHALHRSTGPVDWVRSPSVTELHVRELTAWNDRPDREAGQVRGLLADARAVVDAELTRSAERLAALT